MKQKNLTAEQTAAHNKAVDSFVLAAAKANGGLKAKPCILLPTFVEDNGEWIPEQSTGMRLTKKDGFSFIRFAMPTVVISGAGLPEVKVLKTNVFNDDTKLELLIAAYDLKVGDAMPDTVLVIEESLVPFSLKNPERDIKVAGSGEGAVTCTFQGVLPDGTLVDEPAPIYRRVKLAPAGTANKLIQHTNTAEIQAWAAADRAKNANANKNIRGGNRLAELQAIPKAKRTAAEKAELAELMD